MRYDEIVLDVRYNSTMDEKVKGFKCNSNFCKKTNLKGGILN